LRSDTNTDVTHASAQLTIGGSLIVV